MNIDKEAILETIDNRIAEEEKNYENILTNDTLSSTMYYEGLEAINSKIKGLKEARYLVNIQEEVK